MIKWTQRADADAETIFDHIAEDDFSTAENVITRIIAAVNRLEQFPDMGRTGPLPGTRELVLPRLPFKVIYRHDTHGLTILRVLHTAQLWP